MSAALVETLRAYRAVPHRALVNTTRVHTPHACEHYALLESEFVADGMLGHNYIGHNYLGHSSTI